MTSQNLNKTQIEIVKLVHLMLSFQFKRSRDRIKFGGFGVRFLSLRETSIPNLREVVKQTKNYKSLDVCPNWYLLLLMEDIHTDDLKCKEIPSKP